MTKHILIFFLSYTFSIFSVNKLSAQEIAINTNNFDFQLGLADKKFSGFSTFGFAGSEIIYPDLTLTIDIANAIFSPSISKDFVINLFELSNVATNGTPIQFRIRKLSNFTITVPQVTLSETPQLGVNTVSQVNGGTPNMNGGWNFHQDTNYIYVTSLSGYIFPASGFVQIGFNIQRKQNTANGILNLNTIYTQGANEVNIDNNDWTLRINSNN